MTHIGTHDRRIFGATASGINLPIKLTASGAIVISGVTSGGAGSSTFLGLTDTPADYSGEGGKAAVVNGAEDALEFISVGGTGDVTGDPGSVTDNSVVRFSGASGLFIQGSSAVLDDSDFLTGIAGLDVTNSISGSNLFVTGNISGGSISDGTATFTGGAFSTVVGGQTPTAGTHLVIKDYVDTQIGVSGGIGYWSQNVDTVHPTTITDQISGANLNIDGNISGANISGANANWDDAFNKRVDTWETPLEYASKIARVKPASSTVSGVAMFDATDFTVTNSNVTLGDYPTVTGLTATENISGGNIFTAGNISGANISGANANWDGAWSHASTTHDYAFITGNDGATDVTAAELEELTDASVTALHSHAGGSAVMQQINGDTVIPLTETDQISGANLNIEGNISGAGSFNLSDATAVHTISGASTHISGQLIQEYGAISMNSVQNATISGTATLDFSVSNKYDITLVSGATVTLSPPAGNASNFVVKVNQDAVGSRVIVWANAKFPSGTSPTLTTTANAVDFVSFAWISGAYWGQSSLDFS